MNLCTLDGLARELYTYEGSGTLFTREDYCRVERLGIDDFEEVERLIARGQREGYLKPRSPAEVARILINGFGAEIGAHHFAGVCGLEVDAYADERVGEIVSLYTITRFKGEGVGARLVARALAEARALGLRYVFACTIDERAQGFFERQGFASVAPDEVPAAKWVGYERQRRARLKVLRYDLEPDQPAAPIGRRRGSTRTDDRNRHRRHRAGGGGRVHQRRRQRHGRLQQGEAGARAQSGQCDVRSAVLHRYGAARVRGLGRRRRRLADA